MMQSYRYIHTDETGQRHIRHGLRPAPVPKVPELTPEEKDARATAKRNSALYATDWTQLPDAPLSAEQRAKWAAFRQALRDLPRQPGWPDVAWPVAPS